MYYQHITSEYSVLIQHLDSFELSRDANTQNDVGGQHARISTSLEYPATMQLLRGSYKVYLCTALHHEPERPVRQPIPEASDPLLIQAFLWSSAAFVVFATGTHKLFLA